MPKKEGLEDVHVVYTGDNSGDNRALFSPSFLWHSDVSSSESHSNHWAAANEIKGYIRDPATILHIIEAPDRTTQWWRW